MLRNFSLDYLIWSSLSIFVYICLVAGSEEAGKSSVLFGDHI